MDKLPLSQLIRIGAKLRPQAFGWTINQNGHTCAIGAAYMAKFGEEPPSDTMRCVQALGVILSVAEKIMHLNDLRYSREDIADDLEQQGL